jgi:hypothetical protein
MGGSAYPSAWTAITSPGLFGLLFLGDANRFLGCCCTLPFVLFGVGMLTTPFVEWHYARKSLYVVTDRRLIVMKAGWSTMNIRSFSPAELGAVRRTENAKRSGDVLFFDSLRPDGDGGKQVVTEGFFGVANSKLVEQHVLALKRVASSDENNQSE